MCSLTQQDQFLNLYRRYYVTDDTEILLHIKRRSDGDLDMNINADLQTMVSIMAALNIGVLDMCGATQTEVRECMTHFQQLITKYQGKTLGYLINEVIKCK